MSHKYGDLVTVPTDPRFERSRAAMLGGAAEILYEEGWAAITPENVAARAGVSRSTAYRHWPDRASLVVDTIEAVLDGLAADSHAPASGDLRADLIRELQRFATIGTRPNERRLVAALAHNACDDADIAKLRDRLVERHTALVRAVVVTAAHEGELERTTDPDLAVAELFGPIAFRLLLAGASVSKKFVTQVVDQFIRANSRPDPSGTSRSVPAGSRAASTPER